MSRLVKNTLYNLLGQGALIVLGFVAVKYIFRQLGEDALGIIYFALTASAVLSSMLEMGIGATTIREISAHGANEPAYIVDLIRTGSLFFWSVYACFALALLLGAPAIAQHWIKLRTLGPEAAIRVLRVIGVASLVAFPRTFYVSILRGLQRMEFNNLIDVGTSGLQQFGTIVILLLGGGLMQVAHWMVFCFFACIAAYAFICSRFFPWRALVPGFSLPVVKRNFNFTSNMAAISFLSVVESQADKVLVSKLMPIGMFGYYGIAYAGVQKGQLVTTAISQAALPSLCELHGAGNGKALLSKYNKLQDFLCFVTAPIFAAIPFAALPLFTYVLNAEAARVLLLPITFLCLGYYLNATANAPYILSLAVGRPDISARFTFYALFVVPPAAAALVYFFGLAGAAFSWVVYNLFSYVYTIPRICAECGPGISPLRWYVQVLRFLGPAALIYGLAWTICSTAGHGSIYALVLGYGLASSLFVWGSFLLIGTELRSSLQALVRDFRAKYAEVS
jgi:O-antigen/teichoic acid export membrane protein